jgi:aryl-alcohol dehydrogenase-like predicted oxidoreductase
MSKIALGTVQFGTDYGISSVGGKVQKGEVRKILNYAKSQGINFLDTAPSYGDSEKVLGGCSTHEFHIITKTRHFDCSVIGEKELKLLESDFTQSQIDLKRERIYGVLVHNADDLLKYGSDKIFNQLNSLKQAGIIKKIGVSIYSHGQLQSILDNFEIDLVQLPFNVLDRRMIDSGMFDVLSSKNIEVHARSVFLQGLLLMSRKNRPKKFNRWKDIWALWHEWLNDYQITSLEATVRYAISMPYISKVLVGIHTEDQLKEIVLASIGDLPDIPDDLFIDDMNLLNPVNWDNL